MISLICKKYEITNYTINDDGTIDVDGNVNFFNMGLTELPLTFNKVTGHFECSCNKLTSLKGSPKWISGYFSCQYNQLTSLEFGPDYVGGYFACNGNQLKNNYCDTEIRGSFYTTLKQEGVEYYNNMIVNYNEWRKLYKRKLILDELYKKNM